MRAYELSYQAIEVTRLYDDPLQNIMRFLWAFKVVTLPRRDGCPRTVPSATAKRVSCSRHRDARYARSMVRDSWHPSAQEEHGKHELSCLRISHATKFDTEQAIEVDVSREPCDFLRMLKSGLSAPFRVTRVANATLTQAKVLVD